MPKVDFTKIPEIEKCKGISVREAFRRIHLRKKVGLTRQTWVWRAMDGHLDTLDTITDFHLLNIERYLTGRGDLEFRPEQMTENLAAAERLVLEEIQRRGLTIHGAAHPEARERERERMLERIRSADLVHPHDGGFV